MSTTLFPGVALVIGAGSGIGRATALSFVKEGCKRIVIADRDMASVHETSRMIGSLKEGDVQRHLARVDVLNEENIINLIKWSEGSFGRIDYVVNAAGIIGNNKTTTESSTESFDEVNGINYRGIWLCAKHELKQMLQQEPLPTHDGRPGNRGSIVHIASQLGIVSRPQASAYCASKSAIISMTKSDAIDYSKHNIRINCVCPGVIATPMTEGNEEFRKALEPSIAIAPMNRMGSAQEVADACLFLCSSKATFIQGAALVVDGGYTIN